MTDHARPFDTGRVRPLVTTLDTLRTPIDDDSFDAVILSLDAVAADLGYGDVRPLPGSVAWIDRLRRAGKRILVTTPGQNDSALECAGIADRVDIVLCGLPAHSALAQGLDALGTEPERTIVVAATPEPLAAARAVRAGLAIGLARGPDTPEQLRRAVAATVVADLQELLGHGSLRHRHPSSSSVMFGRSTQTGAAVGRFDPRQPTTLASGTLRAGTSRLPLGSIPEARHSCQSDCRRRG